MCPGFVPVAPLVVEAATVSTSSEEANAKPAEPQRTNVIMTTTRLPTRNPLVVLYIAECTYCIRTLALGELRSLAGLVEPRLLALDDASVARTFYAEIPAESRAARRR